MGLIGLGRGATAAAPLARAGMARAFSVFPTEFVEALAGIAADQPPYGLREETHYPQDRPKL